MKKNTCKSFINFKYLEKSRKFSLCKIFQIQTLDTQKNHETFHFVNDQSPNLRHLEKS